MNSYFYRIFIPLQVITLISLLGIFHEQVEFNPVLVLLTWFLIGPVGIGIGFHKLFSHCQFQTYRPIKYTLAILGTLAAYCPLSFFIVNHTYHHKHADTDLDPSTPKKGLWESFMMWRMRNSALKQVDLKSYPFKVFLKDPVLKFISRNFEYIVLTYAVLMLIIGIEYFVNCFILPVAIEHFRINAVSSFSHLPLPGSYKNFQTKDEGYNNFFLGLITMGFGWHNNHHYDQRQINNRVRWWELDIEGLLAKAISKK